MPPWLTRTNNEKCNNPNKILQSILMTQKQHVEMENA